MWETPSFRWFSQTFGPPQSRTGVPSQPNYGSMPSMMGAGSLFGQTLGYNSPYPFHSPQPPPSVHDVGFSESSEEDETQRMVNDMLATYGLGPKAVKAEPAETPSPTAAPGEKSDLKPKQTKPDVESNAGQAAANQPKKGLFDASNFPVLPKSEKPVIRPLPGYDSAVAAGAGDAASHAPRDPHKAYPPTVKCSDKYPDVYPRDQYAMNKHSEGYIELKEFPVELRCRIDNVRHPEADCDQLQHQHQVWVRKGTTGAQCGV